MTFGPVRPLVRPKTIAGLSDEVIAALRARVATGYYKQPQVISALARSITHRMLGSTRGRWVRGTPLPS